MTEFNNLYKKYQENSLSDVEMRELVFLCGFHAVTSSCKTGYLLLDNSNQPCFNNKIFTNYKDIILNIHSYIKHQAEMAWCKKCA